MWKRGYRSSYNVAKAIDTADWKRKYFADNPSFFKPEGVTVFVGRQGSGKTYSLCEYLYRILKAYPLCKVYSNMRLFGLFNEFSDRIFPYTGLDCLREPSNSIYGVVYVIDEMHLEFNSLESKNTPMSLFTEISQQRKQRKHIIGTAQVYDRLSKPFREQCSEVVFCNNIFGVVQHNLIMDGFTLSTIEGDANKHYGTPLRQYWLMHDQRFYESYDTYEKVIRNGGIRI